MNCPVPNPTDVPVGWPDEPPSSGRYCHCDRLDCDGECVTAPGWRDHTQRELGLEAKRSAAIRSGRKTWAEVDRRFYTAAAHIAAVAAAETKVRA